MPPTDDPPDAVMAGEPMGTSSAVPAGGGSAKKRLLPMELRRRRRAAKLQITSERNVATASAKDIVESINDKDTTEDSAANEPTATRRDAARAIDEASVPAVARSLEFPVEDPSGETEGNAKEAHSNVETPPRTTPPAQATTSATKQLQNLFSFSLLDRKRQKMQQRESLVNVPTSMKVERVPVDLAPKSKAVMSMSFPFPFARPRAASMAAAMHTQPSTIPEVRWLQALQYYVHPASSLPPSLNASNEKQLEEGEFYVGRFRMWQESFRHAYFGLRRLGRSGALYVRYPEFTACFYVETGKDPAAKGGISIVDMCRGYVARHGGPQDDLSQTSTKRLRAVISQSNARLRKDLQRCGIDFRIPFNLRALQKPITNFHLNDDDMASHPIAPTGVEQGVHGPDSLLRFSGHQAVHGLYEFLLNRKPLSNQDVAEIAAAHPFANAAIRAIGVRYMGKSVGRSVGSRDEESAAALNGNSFRSEIELTGVCLPSAISELVKCLEDSQSQDEISQPTPDAAIKVAMETAPMSERLNAMFLEDRDISSGAQTAQDREQWKQQLDFAKRRLQSIKKVGGSTKAEIEMTTR